MNRFGDITMRRALVLLGAFIVVGGFVLALLSSIPFGLYGGVASFGPTGASPAGDIAVGNNLNSLGSSLNQAVYQNANGVPGGTQVVGITTVQSTTTASFGGHPPQVTSGAPPGVNVTGGATGGTGSLLELSSYLAIQSATPQNTAAAVAAQAYSVGGYVAYQSTYKDYAVVVIRVPASQYEQTLFKVEAMGAFVSLTSNSNDVRVQYTDLNATLASLKTEQAALLRLLNQSATINQTLAIEGQLQGVNQQINEVESEILQTKTLIDYATINVTISETPQTAPLSMSLSATPKSGAAPLSVTFNALVKGGAGPYVAIYNFGDGSSNQGQILIHTFMQAGDFNVTVNVTDQKGNVTSAWTMIHVASAPAQIGVSNFFERIANLFVNVVEGIVEVAVVVLPIAAVGAVVILPLTKRGKAQKDLKQNQ
jgi:hypothetical protein